MEGGREGGREGRRVSSSGCCPKRASLYTYLCIGRREGGGEGGKEGGRETKCRDVFVSECVCL